MNLDRADRGNFPVTIGVTGRSIQNPLYQATVSISWHRRLASTSSTSSTIAA